MKVPHKNQTHGHCGKDKAHETPTYRTWRAMRDRCSPKSDKRHYYFDRGITVCDRWRDSFENFLADMGERPAGMTLDRKDVNGGYEKLNCRWATKGQQSENTRQVKFDAVTASQLFWLAHETRIPRKEIAQAFGLALGDVERVAYRQTWRHVTAPMEGE